MKKVITQCNLSSLTSQVSDRTSGQSAAHDSTVCYVSFLFREFRNFFFHALASKKRCDFFVMHCNWLSLCLSLSFSQTKLILQKHLTKNLTNFLPTHLTQPTICTVAANPLALRHPGGTAFIQTPILGPALFRPAPGPLRATHTPIIFSPYWVPMLLTILLRSYDLSLTIYSQYRQSLYKLVPILSPRYTRRLNKQTHTPLMFPTTLKDCALYGSLLNYAAKGERVWYIEREREGTHEIL